MDAGFCLDLLHFMINFMGLEGPGTKLAERAPGPSSRGKLCVSEESACFLETLSRIIVVMGRQGQRQRQKKRDMG